MLTTRHIATGTRRIVQARPRTSLRNSSSVTAPNPPKPEAKPNEFRLLHRCTPFDKWLLVHFKRFPKGEVPDHVPRSTIEKIHSMGRIRANIWLAVGAIFASFYYVYLGKKERAAGNSMAKMNMDWHMEENRKYQEEQKMKKLKES